jgi:lipoprotein NlpD
VQAPGQQSSATSRTIPLKSEPKAFKLPYNEANWSRFEGESKPVPATKAAPIVDGAAGSGGNGKAPPARSESVATPQSGATAGATTENLAFATPSSLVEGVEWAWPVPSKVANGFSDDTKGISLNGSAGQSVLASANGQVSYVGNSLRGYGKMIVIKHNKMFLSVYARNSRVFVKEGQNVGKGQKIAEMGDTDPEGPVLHFEIRRYGKPVDPLKYLPNGAS